MRKREKPAQRYCECARRVAASHRESRMQRTFRRAVARDEIPGMPHSVAPENASDAAPEQRSPRKKYCREKAELPRRPAPRLLAKICAARQVSTRMKGRIQGWSPAQHAAAIHSSSLRGRRPLQARDRPADTPTGSTAKVFVL